MSNASMPASAQVPLRRRWPRRLLVLLIIFIGLPAGYYFYTKWSLDAAIAETDALDPRWRFDDIEAERAVVPDAENSVLQIIKVSRLLGRGAGNTPSSHKHYGELFNELPPTAELNPQQIELIREVLEQKPAALTEARKLKEMPHGRFAITWDPSGVWALMPDHQEVRVMADLLLHDAMLRAQFGDPDAALDSCEAHVNAGASLQGDPFGMQIRVAGDWLLIDALERVLAQGSPKDLVCFHCHQRAALVSANWPERPAPYTNLSSPHINSLYLLHTATFHQFGAVASRKPEKTALFDLKKIGKISW